ncbi:MAG: radical SAM protein [Planctomycetota bacterium]
MREIDFELGPIRPPSEARSLLVRVSRNCPWNRCAFCSVYKESEGYSRRTVDEILADLDAMKRVHGNGPRTAFLQDADPLLMKPDDMVAVLEGLLERFPDVERVTTYARSKTLARRSMEDLRRIREAGLDRVHVGLESGCDAVLDLVSKGATREEQITAGLRAREAGFELSEYVMPGLGGRDLSAEHADDTASAIAAISPDYVRLRTTAVIPGTPLADLETQGRWSAPGEIETVVEIRRFLAGLAGVETRLESDHALNLLMDLRGDLPADHGSLLALCDGVIDLSAEDRILFVLGRRAGRLRRAADLDDPGTREWLERARDTLLGDGTDPEALFLELRRRWV